MKLFNTFFFILTLIIVFLAAGLAFSQCADCQMDRKTTMDENQENGSGEASISQTTCPVMGGEINKEIYTDHKGKRIYFCCEACIETFKQDPEKYLDKMKAQGVTPENTPIMQTVCPVSGKAINTDIYNDHEGERITFCCNGCRKAFIENPEKYIRSSDD